MPTGPGSCEHAIVSRPVLIVDDHAGFRRMVRALLESGGFSVIGETADGQTALAEAARLQPALVLLDIQLPDLDGFEVATRLASSAGPPAVVLTSSRSASSYRRRLAGRPALGLGHCLAAGPSEIPTLLPAPRRLAGRNTAVG